MSTAISSVKL